MFPSVGIAYLHITSLVSHDFPFPLHRSLGLEYDSPTGYGHNFGFWASNLGALYPHFIAPGGCSALQLAVAHATFLRHFHKGRHNLQVHLQIHSQFLTAPLL